jgi:hypothetical protein
MCSVDNCHYISVIWSVFMFFVLKRCIAAGLVLVLTSCAALIPKEHLIPKEELVSTVEKQFPLNWDKGGGLLSIRLDAPQPVLLPAKNRIAMNIHFLAHAALVDIEGDFTGSSQLRYDPAQRAVFLQAASLDALHLKQGNNFSDMLRPQLSRLLGDYAAKHPLYRFKPDELVVLGVKVDVAGITVTSDGVMLTLRTLP